MSEDAEVGAEAGESPSASILVWNGQAARVRRVGAERLRRQQASSASDASSDDGSPDPIRPDRPPPAAAGGDP